VICTDLHNIDLLIEASLVTLLLSTELVLSNFSIATSGNITWLQNHVLGSHLGRITNTSIGKTKRFVLSVRIPIIVSLIKFVMLVERIIEIAVHPTGLGNITKEGRHL